MLVLVIRDVPSAAKLVAELQKKQLDVRVSFAGDVLDVQLFNDALASSLVTTKEYSSYPRLFLVAEGATIAAICAPTAEKVEIVLRRHDQEKHRRPEPRVPSDAFHC